MRILLLTSVSVAALLLAAPADAYQSRVCYAIQQGSFVKWDCGHDPSRNGGVPDFSRPEPPKEPDPPSDPEPDPCEHGNKDGGNKGGEGSY